MYTSSVSTTIDDWSPPAAADSVPVTGVSIVTVADVGRVEPAAHGLVLTPVVLG
jgi:hypothetical protein